MNAVARILAPAALLLASFSASASGLIEIDYPLDQSTTTHASPPARDVGPTFSGLDIHYPGDIASSDQTRSRANVIRELSEAGIVGTTLPLGGHNA